MYNGSNERYAVGGVPVTTGYTTTQVTGPVTTGYTTGYAQVSGGATVVGTTVNTGKEVIKGESRIEYVPF